MLAIAGANPAAIGGKLVKIIWAAIVILLVLAALVATGRIAQKGPHGRGGPLGPPL
jgi:hypothetical protein